MKNYINKMIENNMKTISSSDKYNDNLKNTNSNNSNSNSNTNNIEKSLNKESIKSIEKNSLNEKQSSNDSESIHYNNDNTQNPKFNIHQNNPYSSYFHKFNSLDSIPEEEVISNVNSNSNINITKNKNIDLRKILNNNKIKPKHEKEQKINTEKENINNLSSFEYQQLINEKDFKITELKKENENLKKANKELIEKLNKNDFNLTFKEIDGGGLKEFYENKINFYLQNFTKEKNRIINEFEITIDKLTTGYQSSKDFYLETIKKQEQQLNDYSKGYKIDTEKLNNIIKELQNKIIELQNDNNLIINMNTELKTQNTNLNEKILKIENELTSQKLKEKKYKNSVNEANKKITKLKEDNAKFNRLAYGVVKRSKSIKY